MSLKSTVADKEGFVYFVEITYPAGTKFLRGPYKEKGTAKGARTQLAYYEYRNCTFEILRSSLGDLEPMLEPQEELNLLRAEVAELRSRLAFLEK